MGFWGYLQAIVLFAAVLALAVFTTRMAAFRMRAPGKYMRVVEALPVGPGKQVVMVRVAGKVLLLGVTDKAISRIATVSEEALAAGIVQESDQNQNLMDENSFARMLRKVTGTKK